MDGDHCAFWSSVILQDSDLELSIINNKDYLQFTFLAFYKILNHLELSIIKNKEYLQFTFLAFYKILNHLELSIINNKDYLQFTFLAFYKILNHLELSIINNKDCLQFTFLAKRKFHGVEGWEQGRSQILLCHTEEFSPLGVRWSSAASTCRWPGKVGFWRLLHPRTSCDQHRMGTPFFVFDAQRAKNVRFHQWTVREWICRNRESTLRCGGDSSKASNTQCPWEDQSHRRWCLSWFCGRFQTLEAFSSIPKLLLVYNAFFPCH